jgi:uronate dehydrogenase
MRNQAKSRSAAAIGYRPTQSAEDYAAEILARENPLDPVARTLQGGSFTTMDYTPEAERPGRDARSRSGEGS